MSEGEQRPPGAGAGKIILIIVAVLVGLGIVCCGIGAFLARDQIKGGVQLATSQLALQEGVQKDFGAGTTVTFLPDDEGTMVLVVGVPGGPKPEELGDLQDRLWKVYCTAFAEGGLPISAVGVGAPTKSGQGIRAWRRNTIPVEEVAARTGVPAPAVSLMFQEMMQGEGGVQVRVTTTDGSEDGSEDGGEDGEEAPGPGDEETPGGEGGR